MTILTLLRCPVPTELLSWGLAHQVLFVVQYHGADDTMPGLCSTQEAREGRAPMPLFHLITLALEFTISESLIAPIKALIRIWRIADWLHPGEEIVAVFTAAAEKPCFLDIAHLPICICEVPNVLLSGQVT